MALIAWELAIAAYLLIGADMETARQGLNPMPEISVTAP